MIMRQVSIIIKVISYIELNGQNKDKEKQGENNNQKGKEDEIKDKKEDEKKEDEKKEGNAEESKEKIGKNKDSKDDIEIILDSNRKITNTDVKESSTLILEQIECDILKGEKIKINASGMEGGRGVGDGVTIFGDNWKQTDDNSNMSTNNSKLKPDFSLNLKNKYSYPFIFMIYFEKESKSYFIRAYESKDIDNRILYIKLTHGYSIPLKQKEIFSAGNIIFQVTPLENNNIEIVNLSKQNLSATPKQTYDASSKKEITIGRNKDCDFPFPNNKSFSRIQTTFEFDEENQEWVIIDGSKTKSSTNGTWIFCYHSFQIKDKMIIEVLNNRIQITEEHKGE